MEKRKMKRKKRDTGKFTFETFKTLKRAESLEAITEERKRIRKEGALFR